jgi:Na+/pantothenate symporter
LNNLLFALSSISILFSIIYLIKKNSRFNKKSSMVFMSAGILILLYVTIKQYSANIYSIFYLLQTAVISIMLFRIVNKFIFTRSSEENNEDI